MKFCATCQAMLAVAIGIFLLTTTEAEILKKSNSPSSAEQLHKLHTSNESDTRQKEGAYSSLIPILLQCFSVTLSGYVVGRCGLVSASQPNGLIVFVRFFSLPAVVFFSRATPAFSQVSWLFLAIVFVAKFFIFILVMIVILLLTKPLNLGQAGLYSIFSTQSNDFALGYPLISSLYQDTHPSYTNYLYLFAPIQLLILNPIGFVLMELDRYRRQETDRCRLWQRSCKILKFVAVGMITNPVVVMTAMGVAANLVFHHQLPESITKLLEAFASAFPGTALFLLGLNMVGKLQALSGIRLIVPILLIAAKSFLLPIIIRELVFEFPIGKDLKEILDLSNFGFLYGTIPTAPSVFVFATQYEMATEVVATGMVAGTLIATPMMFASAHMISLSDEGIQKYNTDLSNCILYVSGLSVVCCIWVLIVFIRSKKILQVMHGATFNLVICQLITAIGGLLRLSINSTNNWTFIFQYIVATGGIFASRLWTALLSILLALLHWRGLCYILRIRLLLGILAYCISIVTVNVIAVGKRGYKPIVNNTDPNFHFGDLQTSVATLILIFSLAITCISLIFQQYSTNHRRDYEPLCINDDSENRTPLLSQDEEILTSRRRKQSSDNPAVLPSCSIPDVEDLGFLNAGESAGPSQTFPHSCSSQFHCDMKQRKECAAIVYRHLEQNTEPDKEVDRDEENTYDERNEITRHVVLLIVLSISMLFALSVCLWKLISNNITATFVELEFLDVILNYGQGIITFVIFGLDRKVVLEPCHRLWCQIRYRCETSITNLPGLTQVTQNICMQFLTYHYDKCASELATDRQMNLETYHLSFTGKEFVNWLLAIGLAQDRTQAEEYGNHLLKGQVIQTVGQRETFSDGPYIFKLSENFETRETVQVMKT